MRVHHKNDIAGIHSFSNLLHLIKQGSLLLVPSRRIHNNDVIFLSSKHFDSLFCNLHRIGFTIASVERNLGLGCVLPQLIVSSRTERVSADQSTFPALALIKMRKLCARSCLAGALQTHEHHHVALPLLHLIWLAGRSEEAHKLFDDCLLDELALVSSGRILHIHNCLDILPELSDCSNGNISLQQCCCNLLHHQIQEIIIDHCL
mmetsp:Transcript_17862/g.39417  ORF Transcript_17862/g.39417 Transcript_17862/m.39417 type:complete len:205 (+) Transcript_17862:975-1589(+)